VGTIGGPERDRSGPPRVLVALVAAALVVGGGIVVLVRAGATGEPAARPTSTIGRGTHVCVVVGSPGPDGARFRVPLQGALERSHHDLATTGTLVLAHGDAGFAGAVERLAGRDCDLIATTGVEAAAATEAAARAHPDQHFALIGGEPAASLPNLEAVRFHTDQAGLLAGYLAAGVSQTDVVGAFGSVDVPEVTRVLEGFAAGVRKFNVDRGEAVRLLGWDPETRTGRFVGSPDDQAAGRRAAQRLVADGADVVLAVAGEAGLGAAEVVRGVGNSSMIGSGWDWAENASAPRLWITTVQQRAGVALRRLIAREVAGGFRSGVVEATTGNGGVGLAMLRGPGMEISGKLRYSLGLLATQVADGTVSTDPRRYPPPPLPGATPSGSPSPGEFGD
jgi:basic membrane protein A